MNRRNVPFWNQLRKHDHTLLESRGYGNPWFDSQYDKIRLTVLTIYVKLDGLLIWNYVQKASSIYPGRLEFLVSDVKALKRMLTMSPLFRSPSESEDEWESLELRYMGALHFKHFKGESPHLWPVNKVQAHIDKVGWLGAFPISLIHHGLTYSSYEDPYTAREILLQQGWDPVPLLGVGCKYP